MGLEQWIRDTSPSLAFFSGSKGGGFIGRKLLRPLLAAKAAEDLPREYSPQKFNAVWESLIKQGLIQTLIENGKPKGVPGIQTSAAPSPVPAKASIACAAQQFTPSQIPLASPPNAFNGTDTVAEENARLTEEPNETPPANIREAPRPAGSRDPDARPYFAASRVSHIRIESSLGSGAAGLVTPGGSLTAETARELAEFGGAVIR